jgi:hypothetical protein
MQVVESNHILPGHSVVFDGGNNSLVHPGNIQSDKWENAPAGLKELMNPVRKAKKQRKPHQTPEHLAKDGLDKLAPQKWKLISPGEYWPGTCFPLITIRKPVLIPEHSEAIRLQTTLPIQIVQQVPKPGGIADSVQIVPAHGDALRAPPALVGHRQQTLAISAMAVPLEARLPTAFGTMQVPLSAIPGRLTQQQPLGFQANGPGHQLAIGPGRVGPGPAMPAPQH